MLTIPGMLILYLSPLFAFILFFLAIYTTNFEYSYYDVELKYASLKLGKEIVTNGWKSVSKLSQIRKVCPRVSKAGSRDKKGSPGSPKCARRSPKC